MISLMDHLDLDRREDQFPCISECVRPDHNLETENLQTNRPKASKKRNWHENLLATTIPGVACIKTHDTCIGGRFLKDRFLHTANQKLGPTLSYAITRYNSPENLIIRTKTSSKPVPIAGGTMSATLSSIPYHFNMCRLIQILAGYGPWFTDSYTSWPGDP